MSGGTAERRAPGSLTPTWPGYSQQVRAHSPGDGTVALEHKMVQADVAPALDIDLGINGGNAVQLVDSTGSQYNCGESGAKSVHVEQGVCARLGIHNEDHAC
eukprot:CAMPEP_0117526288 /NCGR_PEP_ID=MMETSP0784-20121206/36207_1 /TAXON_ID=39447 /ORGANISM="" /LENGTH=101 /DNA_ID=CAMNT_0005322509 /DNA_START=473 /DNA_END=779 /DNA_ORIENTATION=-